MGIDWLFWAALTGLPAVALLLTLFNLVAWPRGRADGSFDGRVSVLIPARDEEATIEAAVRAALESSHEVDEVVVYDDGSTDETPNILARLQDEFDRLRVVEGEPLPKGWVGKPHACHQLASAASGDVLFFVDADTFLRPDGVGRIASLLADYDADLVTAVPRQETGSFFERLVLPLLHVTYTSWLPLPLIWKSSNPRFLAANGQLLAIRRDALEEIGGFESVRADVVDDMALCRVAKNGGHRVVFADGYHIADCRMYGSAREVWEGFSKNLYEGIGGTPLALLGVLGLYFATFVLPYLALGMAPILRFLAVPAAAGVGANVVLRLVLAIRHRQHFVSVLLHPIGVLALLAIAINSYLWDRRDQIRWSGRTYSSKQSGREDVTT